MIIIITIITTKMTLTLLLDSQYFFLRSKLVFPFYSNLRIRYMLM